jgi:hypothetical protein
LPSGSGDTLESGVDRRHHASRDLTKPHIGLEILPRRRFGFPLRDRLMRSSTAQTGDIPGAQAEIAKLQSLEDKLLEAKDSYWANQVEVQRLGAAGILAHVQGDDKKAIELARAAADLDATMDKHPFSDPIAEADLRSVRSVGMDISQMHQKNKNLPEQKTHDMTFVFSGDD